MKNKIKLNITSKQFKDKALEEVDEISSLLAEMDLSILKKWGVSKKELLGEFKKNRKEIEKLPGK